MPAGNTPSVSRRSLHRPSERSGLLHEDEASETQQWVGRRGGRRVRLLLVITSLCLALIAKVAGDFSLSTCLTSLIQHHMEASAGFTKSSASSLLSAGTISYALGKLLTGGMIDLLGPRMALSVLLLVACLSHLTIAVAQGTTAVSLIFGGWVVFNVEVAQLWGIVVLIVAMWVDAEHLARALALISLVVELGTLAVVAAYGLAIDSDDANAWRRPFFISAAIALAAAAMQAGTMPSSPTLVGFRAPQGAVAHAQHPLAARSAGGALRALLCSGQAWLVVGALVAISCKELSLLAVAPGYATARLRMESGAAARLMTLNSLGTALGLGLGLAAQPRLSRARWAGVIGASSLLALLVDLCWLLLHRAGAMTAAALQLGMVLQGLGHALPFYLPAQLYTLQLGGVRHCAMLSSLVDLATTAAAAAVQASVEDTVRDAAFGAWLVTQLLLALLGLALLALFLRRDGRHERLQTDVHRPPPAPPAHDAGPGKLVEDGDAPI